MRTRVAIAAQTRDDHEMVRAALTIALVAACGRSEPADTKALETRIAKLEARVAAQAAAQNTEPAVEAHWTCNGQHCFRAAAECESIKRSLESQDVKDIQPCKPAPRAWCVQMVPGGRPLCFVDLQTCGQVEPRVSSEPKLGSCIGVE